MGPQQISINGNGPHENCKLSYIVHATEWTEVHQVWEKHIKTTIGASQVALDFT